MRNLMTACLFMAMFVTHAPAGAAPIALEMLLEPSGIGNARLSPDGKHIAALSYDGRDYNVVLAKADKPVFKVFTGVKYLEQGFVTTFLQPLSVVWLSNDLLAINFQTGAWAYSIKGEARTEWKPAFKIFALDRWPVARLGEYVMRTLDSGDPETPLVLAYADAKKGDVAIIDAKTGARTKFRFPVSGTPMHIAYDRGGNPRAITVANSDFWKDVTLVSNWFRASPEAPWEKLAEFKVTDPYWTPLYVPDEADTLVISSSEGRDTAAVFSYDTKKKAITELLAGHPSEDIVDVDGLDKAMFSRVWTSGMRASQFWFDADWARLQVSVDAALPGRLNIMHGNPASRVVILSQGDTDPGTWYVLDTVKMSMIQFGRQRASVDAAAMRPMQVLTYPARDGLTIPAYLTVPDGPAKSLPTVIMIHGGPAARDEWEWNDEVQFLASRGYAVLQPQFRGSTGFGRKFEQAGYGQWGLNMQDDVTAGVDYLIKQGIADPSRICIYGASYGGYAALWGLVKTPDLFKCGISFAGVVDLELMFKDSSDRNSKKPVREVMRFRIGDMVKDSPRFDQVSPLKSAQKIKVPVLLMHGRDDQRVPLEHGKRMLAALQLNGKKVEWLEFEDEGHGLRMIRNRWKYLTAMEKFLAEHIGPAPEPVPVQLPSQSP